MHKAKKRLLVEDLTLSASASVDVETSSASDSFDAYGAFTLYIKPTRNSGTSQDIEVTVVPYIHGFGALPEESLGTISAADITAGTVNKFISDDMSIGSFDYLKVKLSGDSGTYGVTASIRLIGVPL